MRFDFRDGDRVRLIDGYPVREEYWGQEGTVVNDWLDVDRHRTILVVYDFRPDRETWSEADTLIPICDDVDVTELNSFLDNQ